MPLKLIAILAVILGAPPFALGAKPPPRPGAYALLIGSNSAGPGQKPLRYAHDDVRRVKKVLLDLGGFSALRVDVLHDPSRASLMAALDRAHQALSLTRKGGGEPLFFFFYSGHARARALDLGKEEFELMALRKRLAALPAKATIAVLDACQTGAISRVKGAHPAADFSHNSVNDLDTAGMAVMASSSASEMSQESDRLGASVFTHHLVVGLRGAADTDADGRVTLAETYRYAYDRTLVSTASTMVGKQHVTLETQLRGKGEMVLSYPLGSPSLLVLPASLAGDLLISRNKHVMAELHKVAGKPVRLALAPGRYEALVGRDPSLRRCHVALIAGQISTLSPRHCAPIQVEKTASKGARGFVRPYMLELEYGFSRLREDAFNARLETFGYEGDSFFGVSPSAAVTLGYRPYRHFTFMLGWQMLDAMESTRSVGEVGGTVRRSEFNWRAHAIRLGARASLPFWADYVESFAELSVGLCLAFSTLKPAAKSDPDIDEIDAGPFVQATLGALVRIYGGVGLVLKLSYSYAPALSNLAGDTHDHGGFAGHFGLHFEI